MSKLFRTFIVLLTVVGVPVFAPCSEGGETARPNILFLMADQLRADSIGCDGNPVVKTPHLDRLAAEGAYFKHAYSSTPSCTPARAGILTGLSPWHHGMLGYNRIAVKYEREMPRMFTEAGYETTGIGKMHYHPQRNGHGFERLLLDESGRVEAKDFISDYRQWFKKQAPELDPDKTGIDWNSNRAAPYALPEELHPTRWTGDRAVEYLQQYDGRKPFFLKVSFARPHSPYDPPQRYWDMYENAEIPNRDIGDWCARHEQHGKKQPDTLWQGDLGEEAARRARIGYYANTTFIDDQIGRIIEVLKERNLLENTFILFVSDHGDMLGDHHLWRKTYAYESSTRVPLLVRWGKTTLADETGVVFSQPVELRDILPTFLDAAKIDYEPDWFDGRSLKALIENAKTPWRDHIDLEHSTCYAAENNWTGLTDGKIKYIYFATEGREQLFDLEKDPRELHDLASSAEHRDTLESWRNRMIEHLGERDERYVKDGKLTTRPGGIVRSPNYPADRK